MFKQYLGFVLYALISLPAFAQTNGSVSLSDLEQAQKYDEALRGTCQKFCVRGQNS